ncbi:K02A2.6-like [Cordylochernes scorpioides]|uniref:RNA-directed DNA polymerase n=1 Tax=Cordylochernes scorpioides TaxID=51811 RepID=A0ABY6LCB3_9ARAC|nr:K02A2.6-like [Cordylochernes scorpioides]
MEAVMRVRSGADPVPWNSVYFSTSGGSGFCWDDVEGSAPDTIGLAAVLELDCPNLPEEQLDNHVLSDVDIEEPAPDTMINRQTESSESDRPQRTRTIPKRFDDYVLATTNETIPKDYEEAITCEDKKHWENAMLEEIQNMYSHQVWELVPRPVNAKVVKRRDYNESFSPVIKNATLRTILSMAATKDSVIKLFDVKAAYLNGNIENTIFMEQPAGFVQDRNKVCKLNKSIYGLPQSGRSWYEKFSQVLHDCGLEKLKSDPCLFKWKNEDKYFYVGIYVDDFITVSDSEDTSNRFINKLRHHLEIKDVTCKGMFLGIKIIQDKEGISLQQSHYVQQILQKYGMENCKEVPTPGSKEINLDNHIEDDNCDQHTYQEALGMLMFLAVNTRPDIAYITSKLSQYSRQPKQMHWTAIKRVMRYLQGTIDLGVKFERGKTGILKSYTDASWSTTHDGKSYGGYVLKLGEATIDWKSSKQPLVALSTMEAEMIAACESCCQIKWIINLLRELEEWNFMEKPTAIYTDSQSLINWISSPKQSSRCRHINRKYHFLRDCYESRDICLLYKPSQDLEADIFTKDLSRDQMKKHLESLSIVGIKPKKMEEILKAIQAQNQAMQAQTQALQAQNQETREALNQAFQAQNQETREALNEALQAQNQELKESLGLKFQCLEDEISAVREDVSSVKEDVSSVKEEVKEKISALEERLAAVETGHPRTPVFQQDNNNSGRPLVKVPTFDGQSSWTSFKTQFDVVAQANGWNVRDKASFLAAALRGPAVDVLQMIPEQLRLDFNSLIDALESRYGEEHYQQLHVVKFKNRLQEKKESLQDLANDIRRLARLAFPTCPAETQDFMAQQQFIDAIGDPETQKFARLSSATTLQETLVQAMKHEAAQQASRGSYRMARQVKLDNPGREKGRCWTCGANDHLSPTCPRKVKQRSDTGCWKCGKDSHIRKNCPDNSKNPSAPRKNQENYEYLRNTENGLLLRGFINGRRCDMVIDTGANVTLVRTDVFQNLYPKPAEVRMKPISLQTATGERAKVHHCVLLSIQIGSKIFQHKGYVADIMDECIIGLDVLRQFGLSIDIGRNLLRTSDEDIPLLTSQQLHNFQACRVLALEDTQVPPRSECVIKGQLETTTVIPKFAILEGDSEAPSRGILVAKELIDTGRDVIPVRVVNLYDSARAIKKGSCLGNAEPAVLIKRNHPVMQKSKREDNVPDHLQQVWEETMKELQPGQQKELATLLATYGNIFAKSSEDYGRTDLTKHRINTGESNPIKQAPHRIPLARRQEAETLVKEMLDQNIIEPSSSPWVSPVVLVKKKDGSTRFCVDYRKLNDVTKKDSYPFPRIDATLDTLAGSQWFSTLDLKSGYWQVEMHPDDKEKTAFTTGSGLWQFNVMPFGLCNAPATFERLMEAVLQGLATETCMVYLDDIIVLGKNFEEHLSNIEKVFKRLEAANLKLSPKKCKLFKKEVAYLGHIISAEGVQTDPEKTETVRMWPTPKDLTQLRSFLGLCTYYRRFIPGFSNIARPLHRLTESGRPFVWTPDCQRAMEKLKEMLVAAPILAYPRPGDSFILDTDASNTGIGGVLSQVQEGSERVIAYFSKTLSKPERNYCVTRKELLAIVKSIEHFHHYLYGQEFILRSDHASLQWLLNFKNPEGQLARWIQRLQEYQVKIQHRPGKRHQNADALSRRPCVPQCGHCARAEDKYGVRQVTVQESDEVEEQHWTGQALRKSQREDRDLLPMINWKESDERPSWEDVAPYSPKTKGLWSLWNSLTLRDGVLYRKWESEDGKHESWKLVLPRSHVPLALQEMHSSPTGGHFGIRKTLAKARERFFWPESRADVEKWCRNCTQCSARKGPTTRSKGKLKIYNVGAPFERIAIDVAGPFPKSDLGNKYILVIMDYFTKWPVAVPIPDQEASTVSEALLQDWVCLFGVPRILHSDQGRNFESNIFQELCRRLGIEKTRTTPLHPQSDGMVERFNRTLTQHLTMFVNKNQRDWDQHLPMLLMAYRSAEHESTGYSPARMLFGHELRMPCDVLLGRPEETFENTNEYISHLEERMLSIHQWAREKLHFSSEKMKDRYNVKTSHKTFKEGEMVWLHNPQRKKGLSPKLQYQWEGPYKIIKCLNDVIYRIQKTRTSKPKVVHYNRLAPFRGSVPEQWTVRDDQS